MLACLAIAALLGGCYLGKDRKTRRGIHVMDGLLVAGGAGLLTGAAAYDAGCDRPYCEKSARNLYGTGGGLVLLGVFLALGTYLFQPPPTMATSPDRPPRGTNAPTVDRPD